MQLLLLTACSDLVIKLPDADDDDDSPADTGAGPDTGDDPSDTAPTDDTGGGDSGTPSLEPVIWSPGEAVLIDRPSYWSAQVFLADITGDGHLDIVVVGTDDQYGGGDYLIYSVEAHVGRGDGAFSLPQTTVSGYHSGFAWVPADVADFNGDGKADVAVALANAVNVFRSEGDGRFYGPLPSGFTDDTLEEEWVGGGPGRAAGHPPAFR
jgi:hypothetical protein